MVETIVPIASLLASITGVVFSLWALRAQSRANQVSATAARNQYFSELRKWADEACGTLSVAVHLCDLDPAKCQSPSFFERRHAALTQLSGLIDRGRWFFPNDKTEVANSDRPRAYQGYRHKVLDSLVQAYRLVEQLNFRSTSPNLPQRKKIEDAKCAFVSEVQSVLDPCGREEEFRRIVQK